MSAAEVIDSSSITLMVFTCPGYGTTMSPNSCKARRRYIANGKGYYTKNKDQRHEKCMTCETAKLVDDGKVKLFDFIYDTTVEVKKPTERSSAKVFYIEEPPVKKIVKHELNGKQYVIDSSGNKIFTCSLCSKTGQIDFLFKISSGRTTSVFTDGIRNYCKECHLEKERKRDAAARENRIKKVKVLSEKIYCEKENKKKLEVVLNFDEKPWLHAQILKMTKKHGTTIEYEILRLLNKKINK